MSGTRGPALVTGAARRIGLAIATRLAEAGYSVALHASARSRERAEAEAVRLTARGFEVRVLSADLADAEACRRLVREATDALGAPRLLVNNAAVFEVDGFPALDPAIWDRQFAVNLRAPVLLSQAFADEAAPGAAIVNIIDQRVLRPTPQAFSYTLAKSALWTATRAMAQALAERDIRVNAVGPGPTLANAVAGEPGFRREVAGVPLHRAVDPNEIAAAVMYLAEAPGVTGQIIAVDAGQHLGWRTPDVVE